MIRISNLRLPLNYSEGDIHKAAATELRIDSAAIKSCSLYRISVDARKRNDIFFVAAADAELYTDEEKICRRCKNAHIVVPTEYKQLFCRTGVSPVVAGAGPAGLFAALILARAGTKPILIDRGADVDTRARNVEEFLRTGKLCTESNVQFGEGGAGTFSDGKLNTGTKDSRQRFVLEEFAAHGAPEEILTNAKPHIGTDKLRLTVKNIRQELLSLGATVMFGTRLTGFVTESGRIRGAKIISAGRESIIETDSVILAIGHSSRDTFEMLFQNGFALEAKPFSAGVRIEHLREKIDKALYGKFAGTGRLSAASYKLSTHLSNGRGVYTFCMCPGGRVINASSEENALVTNGMSEFARDGINSNSALLVGVNPNDFPGEGPLRGMYFQRRLERKAFKLGGGDYRAPVQRVEDFLLGRKSTCAGEVTPSVGRCSFADINGLFPEYIESSLKLGITALGKKLRGFDSGDAIITAAESRSSSPVRILRDPVSLESPSAAGLYPCGEGAGYAGGIVSAAVDGMKCAEKILEHRINSGSN